MEKNCSNCVHHDRADSVYIDDWVGGDWAYKCVCPDKPPSTGYTYPEDYCKHHEGDEDLE